MSNNETFNSYPQHHEAPQEGERVLIPAEEFERRREALELAEKTTPEVQAPPTPKELIGRQSLILFQTRCTTAEEMASRTETLDNAA
jgi:hypothetical protein